MAGPVSTFRPQRLFRRRWVQQCQHFAHGGLEPDEQGAANNRVARIEGFEVRHDPDGGGVLVVQSVAGIDAQAERVRQCCRLDELLDFRCRVSGGPGVGIGAGVEFDKIGADLCRRANLVEVGINKEADDDAGPAEPGDGEPERGCGRTDVQTAFSGDFGPFFWNEANFVGLEFFGDGDDFWNVGHFEVEAEAGELSELADIAVVNMAAVFAEMHGNPVCARR